MRPRVERRAVGIVDAQVRGRMAKIRLRPPANVHGLVRPVLSDLRRRRAVSPRAAIRVHGAIATNVTDIRTVVRGRGTANARYLGAALRVGEALVVGAPAGPDEPFIREAAAGRAGCAVGVRLAGCGEIGRASRAAAGRVRLAGRCRTALRGAACRRGPMVEGDARVAHRRCSRVDRSRCAGNGCDHVRAGVLRVGARVVARRTVARVAAVCVAVASLAVTRLLHLAAAARDGNERNGKRDVPHVGRHVTRTAAQDASRRWRARNRTKSRSNIVQRCVNGCHHDHAGIS
jgi:hypothetical protein